MQTNAAESRVAHTATATASCAVCGATTTPEVARPASTYAPRGTYGISRCTSCGCGQTTPFPNDDELSAIYSKEYTYDAHLLIEPEKRWRARRILDVALEKSDRRVLDIGCMYGYLLEEARARGVTSASGIELSAGPAAAAQKRGLDVFNGTVESFATKSPAPFDLVVAQHVLEHIPSLESFLGTVRTLMTPSGRLCICVPNYEARARRVFREAWGWYQVPVHLHHFGLQSLELLLSKHGFTIDRHLRRGGDSLFVLLTLLQGLGRSGMSEQAQAPSRLAKAAVRTASALLRPYYFVGDDELLIVARPKREG